MYLNTKYFSFKKTKTLDEEVSKYSFSVGCKVLEKYNSQKLQILNIRITYGKNVLITQIPLWRKK